MSVIRRPAGGSGVFVFFSALNDALLPRIIACPRGSSAELTQLSAIIRQRGTERKFSRNQTPIAAVLFSSAQARAALKSYNSWRKKLGRPVF